jgi:hypothetical protein
MVPMALFLLGLDLRKEHELSKSISHASYYSTWAPHYCTQFCENEVSFNENIE